MYRAKTFSHDNKIKLLKVMKERKCCVSKVYRYHKLRKTFSKFYRRHYELVSKFNVGLKTLLHQGLSEPEFYGDLVYKFKKIVGLIFLISSEKLSFVTNVLDIT